MIDPKHFRNVLGAYPTGVALITAIDDEGERTGMVVGSFTSISLDPPLVGFFPDKGSSTYPKIEKVGRFCVNVLGSDQKALCQRFASKQSDKFLDLAHGTSPSGQPVFDEALAWVDCAIERIEDIGDHWLVIGRVEALDVCGGDTPLLFHRGGYHSSVALVD
ncbi:flavin reductase family protein [Croceicoccus naphthovorans]|uniref:Monooxygenase n=1 Tax=Croceicoccus naphthovorans TaxID=1348774 RepID=A0A0G3XKV8_9SPHN|nr:flavin reductase family protein [Croceicoccus naphthovorans]AKM11236.1 monooxygenase [Croceicoccus naphthovorans]MBB3989859.1 flavin reductase (DIM6/NTAB) family NADH-FMN oxidoreductase RutF [Croceicoccus naphthovorans]